MRAHCEVERMDGRLFAIVASLIFTGAVAARAAEPPPAHVVRQIVVDGKNAESAAATVSLPGGPARATIRIGDVLPDGTRIDVPAHVVVTIANGSGTSTVTIESGASVTFVSTGKGEVVRSNGGKAIFDVVHGALDFYRVQYGTQITAGLQGTSFSIDASSGSVTFVCTRDAMAIAKTGILQIGTDRRPVTLVDAISAAGRWKASYAPTPSWTLATFADYASAEASFEAAADAAARSGDAVAEAAALNDLGLIYTLAEEDDKAARAFATSARLGNAQGETALGLLYENGTVATPQNAEKALDEYELAAAQGDPAGLRRAACLYQLAPSGITQNSAKALSYFDLAAAQGDYLSEYYAGLMYETGTSATPKDSAVALKRFARAEAAARAAGLTDFAIPELGTPPADAPLVLCRRG